MGAWAKKTFNIFFAPDNIKITRFPRKDLTLLDGPGAVGEFGGLGMLPPPRGNYGQGIQFQQRPCASTTNFEEKKVIFSAKRRSRSDGSHSLSESLTE